MARRRAPLLTPLIGRAPLRMSGAIARAAGKLSRRLGRGGGTTLPGVVLLGLRPNAIAAMSRELRHGCVLISATNGKTTTTRLIVAAAEALGLCVVTNAEGSNLERGVAAALLHGPDQAPHDAASSRRSGAPWRHADIGIFEVDEAALPAVARATRPRTLVLLNLFRDQLDRYGELDTLVELWRDLLDDPDATDTGCALVLNADDPNLADLGRGRADRGHNVIWFGIDDTDHALDQLAHAADATNCRQTGEPIVHDVVLLGHLGHWRTASGTASRPPRTVSTTRATLSNDGQTATITIDDSPLTLTSSLPGLHNTYNLTAAVAATETLPGIHRQRATAAAAIAATGAAFGRGERIPIDDRRLDLLLAKNPTGVNQNIRTVLAGGGDRHVLVLLNDRTADGQDVSWIWDVDWEPLDGRLASLTLGGDRAHDLALRFRYGGFDLTDATIEPDIATALDSALAASPAGSTVHALPTYTAMLDLRAELNRRGVVDAYWEAP